MDARQVLEALDVAQAGRAFRTPDNRQGAVFILEQVTQDVCSIRLASGRIMHIPKAAFVAAYEYLRTNQHDIGNRCAIGSSDDRSSAGPLCEIARGMNGGQRCINYIIPILASIGAADFSGSSPNCCWYLNRQ